jgi:arsenate reductase
MAEGLLRDRGGKTFDVSSAGTEETRVHPLAIEAMKEIGIDISSQTSKTLERFVGEPWDYVITVCDRANESCPLFPGGKQRLHWSFDDPSAATGTEAQRLEAFRRIRDEIASRIRDFFRDAS